MRLLSKHINLVALNLIRQKFTLSYLRNTRKRLRTIFAAFCGVGFRSDLAGQPVDVLVIRMVAIHEIKQCHRR